MSLTSDVAPAANAVIGEPSPLIQPSASSSSATIFSWFSVIPAPTSAKRAGYVRKIYGVCALVPYISGVYGRAERSPSCRHWSSTTAI